MGLPLGAPQDFMLCLQGRDLSAGETSHPFLLPGSCPADRVSW